MHTYKFVGDLADRKIERRNGRKTIPISDCEREMNFQKEKTTNKNTHTKKRRITTKKKRNKRNEKIACRTQTQRHEWPRQTQQPDWLEQRHKSRGKKGFERLGGEGNRRLLCKANGGPQPKCMMLFYTSRTGASVSKDQKIDTPRCNVYDLTTISNVWKRKFHVLRSQNLYEHFVFRLLQINDDTSFYWIELFPIHAKNFAMSLIVFRLRPYCTMCFPS